VDSLQTRIGRTLIRALIIANGFYVAFVLMVYLGQSRMLFLPDIGGRTPTASPADIRLGYEDAWLSTDDGERLHGWLVRQPQARATLLFCHGNAGNIGHRLDSIEIFAELGLDVLIFDYRGYGRSSGTPSEQGSYRDADAAWRWLIRERGIAPASIVLFGRSLGAAVAVELATRVRAAGLIVESAFTSVPDRGSELYPLLPVRLLSRFHYDNRARIAGVGMPLLVVHSRQDEIIPFQHGQVLYATAREPKRLLELSGGHNDGFLVSRERYRQGLDTFLKSLGSPQG
jgi:fermentation-respiration switch protein FrsA (DUF1100 family)